MAIMHPYTSKDVVMLVVDSSSTNSRYYLGERGRLTARVSWVRV
jgi:hypothetical protein